nr:efflux RND transporter periplasmic adaptor subunit [uncultured Lichenicoccus sp.]
MTWTRRTPAFLLLPSLLACGLATLWHRQPPPPAPAAAADATQVVSAMTVHPEPWQSLDKAYGQVRAVEGADLAAQVSGIVSEIDFRSGDMVHAGTVLLRLRLYDDPAKLQQLQSQVELYDADLARDRKQFEAQAISRATLDLDTANLHNAQAQVAAQMQLMDEKVIRAPFDGRLGIREVDLGQFLPAGNAAVNLESLDPIDVDFNVPQQQVATVAPGQPVAISVDAWPARRFQARILAIDSRIDGQSRMATIRAALDNHDHALLPGMFAIARLKRGAIRQVLAVPHASISFNPYGDFIYVLAPRNGDVPVATARVVVLGETRGDRVVVLSGLTPGEQVVTAGQSKLHDGSPVRIDNSVQPENDLDPSPPEE